MDVQCVLREAMGAHGEKCDGPDCIYWRALSHVGEPTRNGCAVEHNGILGDEALMGWLLTVKQRLKDTSHAVSDDRDGS